MSEAPARREADKQAEEQPGDGGKRPRGPRGDGGEADGGGIGTPLLLWAVIVVAFVGAVGFAIFMVRRDREVHGGAGVTQAARVTGARCGYTIEQPAGWKRVDPKSMGAAAPGDLDLWLVEENGAAVVFVLIEEVPADLFLGPDGYFEAIVGLMKKNGPGTTFSEDAPLPQDPDNGVIARVQTPDDQGVREGYVATLLTPRWALRVVATAPREGFAAQKEALLRVVSSLAPPPDSTPPRTSFEEARRAPTRLVQHGAAPGPYKDNPLPEDVEKVRYDSGPLSLGGYFLAPHGAADGKAPGLVYLHGGFAFGNEELGVPRMFAEAGFAVLVPTYRGENGNPGEYELFRGELDDAAAAVRWLAARKEVDAARIHVFGYNIGGGLAALMALLPDVPVASTGSAGGAFEEATFDGWEKDGRLPFDPLDRAERRVRVPGPFLREIRRPHHVYAGQETAIGRDEARRLADRARRLGKPVIVEGVPGDQALLLMPAAKRFLAAAQAGR